MTTKASSGGSQKEFKLVPAGTHLARCYGFVHIGTVPNTFPQAKSPTVNKIRLIWELPEELTVFKDGEEPKPFTIAQEYTLSMNEKANLRKMIQSWLGKTLTDEEANDFDVESLVGMDCLLTVTHVAKGDKTYSNINNITRMPAKMVCPPQINATSIITWETLKKDAWMALPKFLQDKMQESEEFRVWAPNNSIDISAF